MQRRLIIQIFLFFIDSVNILLRLLQIIRNIIPQNRSNHVLQSHSNSSSSIASILKMNQQYYPLRKSLDSLINNEREGESRSWKSVGVDFTVGTCGWSRPKLGEAELPEFSMNWWSEMGGRAETKDIRLFGGGRRRPLSTSVTTGSIEFRWITIARKRTLTSPVVGVLASSIRPLFNYRPFTTLRSCALVQPLVLLGKRSNPLLSPRTKTTSLFFQPLWTVNSKLIFLFLGFHWFS